MPQRLMLFVEGKGDKTAVPTLAKRVVKKIGANDAIFIDADPFVVKGLGNLVKDNHVKWRRWLAQRDNEISPESYSSSMVIWKRSHHPGHNTLTDTDQTNSAPTRLRRYLAMKPAPRRGEAFSLGIVCHAGIRSVVIGGSGKSSRNSLGRRTWERSHRSSGPPNAEIIRDAKGRLRKIIPLYDQSLDQGVLAAKVDLAAIEQRCRSFRRFQSAIQQLAIAIRNGKPIISPVIA